MVQVPKALAPEPYKSPIARPLSAEQRDALQPIGPGDTRYPEMPIPDVTPLRVGTIEQPQNFVTARSRRTDMLNMMAAPAGQMQSQVSELLSQLTTAINSVSAENGSDTPDFILAHYLLGCLRAFDAAVTDRDRWYGRGRSTQGLPAQPGIQGVPGDPNIYRNDPTDGTGSDAGGQSPPKQAAPFRPDE